MFCTAVVTLVLSLVLTSTNVSDQDFASLKSHVSQLEQILTDLQSKINVKEQIDAAVLSSVLAKLTTTTDELTALRTEQNTTVFAEMHNKPSFPRKGSAFQASSEKETVYLKDDAVLVFDHVITGTDTSYNSSSGVFTAPVNGIYFMYANILPNDDKATFTVLLKKGDYFLSRGLTRTGETTSLNAPTYLNEGESVWFTTRGSHKVWAKLWSYIGGFLVAEL